MYSWPCHSNCCYSCSVFVKCLFEKTLQKERKKTKETQHLVMKDLWYLWFFLSGIKIIELILPCFLNLLKLSCTDTKNTYLYFFQCFFQCMTCENSLPLTFWDLHLWFPCHLTMLNILFLIIYWFISLILSLKNSISSPFEWSGDDTRLESYFSQSQETLRN